MYVCARADPRPCRVLCAAFHGRSAPLRPRRICGRRKGGSMARVARRRAACPRTTSRGGGGCSRQEAAGQSKVWSKDGVRALAGPPSAAPDSAEATFHAKQGYRWVVRHNTLPGRGLDAVGAFHTGRCHPLVAGGVARGIRIRHQATTACHSEDERI
eukprot:363283-Chlamydomonas_euryale.AAC.9